MRDFYKVLGVNEDASEEEIRERWIELTKQYHPDRGEESTSDEKIREINEAYQVLKHSSTRVEYDLKRAFNHGQRRRKGTVHFKRWGVPTSILIILIIVGLIYIKNHQSSPSSNPIVSNKIDSINQTNQRNQKDQRDQINQRNQISERDQINEKDQTDKRNEINQTDQMSQTKPDKPDRPDKPSKREGPEKPDRTRETRETRKDQINQKDQTTTPSIAMAATIKKVQLVQPPQNPIIPLANDIVANKPTPSINQTDQRNKINQINEIDQRNQINLNIEVAQFKPPSLIATEDEVKKFFNDYVNYYNRKDTRSILSVFSSKVIQNQKDGLEEIRKIYADFFSEGQEVRYSLQDMKIEIYQNAVEAKARYEIEQIVRETGEKEVWRGPIGWVLIKEEGKLKILSVDYKYQRPL